MYRWRSGAPLNWLACCLSSYPSVRSETWLKATSLLVATNWDESWSITSHQRWSLVIDWAVIERTMDTLHSALGCCVRHRYYQQHSVDLIQEINHHILLLFINGNNNNSLTDMKDRCSLFGVCVDGCIAACCCCCCCCIYAPKAVGLALRQRMGGKRTGRKEKG